MIYKYFEDILDSLIKQYCKRHNLDYCEINHNTHTVFYLTLDNNSYDSFDYLEVDLDK